jgi:diguanylate cyclase (GGDEF)-like protein/PAS domain S-box-containing protein
VVRAVILMYGLWTAAWSVAYFASPRASTIAWAAIGVGAVAAVLLGVLLNRPRRAGPWLLLAGAMLAYAAGDLAYHLAGQEPDRVPAQYLDEIFYALMFVLVTAGLLRLAGAGAAARDRAALIDALVLMTGVGLLVWVFLVEANATRPELTVVQKAIAVAYPLADVAILAMVTRLVTAVRWTRAVTLLTAGATGLLVSDVIYRIDRLQGTWTDGGPVDLGWLAFYFCWGAAALHPSMREITEPRTGRQRPTTAPRLALLALASLIPPGILLFEASRYGLVRHGAVIAVTSVVMFLLVLIRLAGVAGELREQIGRERGLRDVTTALVAATDSVGITNALHDGVRRLLPPGTPYELLLLTSDGAGGSDASGEWNFGRPRPALVPTAALPTAVADRLGPAELTLACPLVLSERLGGRTDLGVLLVSAPQAGLAAARDSIAVLASQAALAIDRVILSRELIRHNSEEYFRALVHNAADVILIVDDDNTVRYASPSAAAVFGAADLAGMPLLDLLDERDRAAARRSLAGIRVRRTVVGDGGDTDDWTVLGRDGGNPVQVEASWRNLRDDPAVRGLVVTLRDVTEQRRLERELTHRAFHDALTGLANRVLFAERVQNAIVDARTSGGVVGVLFIDLDDFKVVNDTLGHECGDELLISVSRRLTEVLRHNDTAARLGGDEFATLIEDAHDVAGVEDVAERIAAALREPFVIGGQLISCAGSIGVGTTADAAEGPELLRQADLALYVAKGSGKGQWRRYQPDLHTAIVERMELRADLDQAIHDDAFLLEYQPIVALGDGQTAGFEALVRWNHPTRGRLLPNAFIDVAEESGLVVPIGEWVLRAAVAAAARWQEARPDRPPYVSINVSAWQFRSPGFIGLVARELARVGLPAECLMLEITESLLLRDDDQVWDDLTELRQIGVRVAIDDFGTGYSSLSYLRHVPLDVLKIDRLFTGTISSSAQQRALVDGIVRLAHTLGLQVVAEGIETPAERDLLAHIGCPYGQGYLFARPMHADDAEHWLRRAEEGQRVTVQPSR